MFYRFIAMPDPGGAYLAFGPARVRIDFLGRWLDSTILPPYGLPLPPERYVEIEAVLASVRGVLPDIVTGYTAETGLIRFGKPTSSRRMALLEHIAATLNASIDAPAPAADPGVFG